MQDAKVNTTGSGRIGVLIVNLGTPEATSYWPMRRYLKEFLSDRRVIETNRVLWWFILNGIILTIRPKRSGHAYEQIWNRELNESPLKTITRAQAERLDAYLRLWPLLRGRPEIASLSASRPQIRLAPAGGADESAPLDPAEAYRRVMASVVDALRRFAPDTQVSIEDVPEPATQPTENDLFLSEMLRRVVDTLSEKARLVVILRYQEDLDPAEIAEVLDMPLNTVKSHLRRSLSILRDKLSRTLGEVSI